MRLIFCRGLLWMSLVSLPVGIPASAQAGLIPWAYNAVFGYGPIFGGGYQNYAWGGPAYAPGYTTGYAPYAPVQQMSYYSPSSYTWSAGYAPAYDCGSCGTPCGSCGNPCSSCSPCSPCGIGGCASGDCATGNCGAGYTPASPETEPKPTEAAPEENQEPANQEPEQPLQHNAPPADDFGPTTPRTNDSTVPDLGSSSTIPVDPSRSTIPVDPNRSTIPVDPNRSTIPSGAGTPTYEGGEEPFRRPTTIPDASPAPAPAEPMIDEALPFGTDSRPGPLNVEPVPVASVKVERRRILTTAEYRVPTVARLNVEPRDSSLIELAHK